MNLIFISEKNNSELINATEEYENIWMELNEEIVKSLGKITNLKFQNKKIQVTIFEGMSSSHPLKLRASYSTQTKKATLIHELGHILLVDNNVKLGKLTSHQLLFLFLYDVWFDLFGKKFADDQILVEKKRSKRYEEAWNWALTMTRYQRKELLQNILS